MKKNFRKPENWQDFESLCKKLWAEVWSCPTIKKNGRPGQQQHGVDISGIPRGETAYHGIQCKGKSENYGHKIKREEIDTEIQNAEKFLPPLGSLIISTSSSKDAKIEEYVRSINLERVSSGKFGVELYCWEDIEDLIEEHRDTFNWYVNEFQFRDKYDVEIRLLTHKGTDCLFPHFMRKTITLDSQYVPEIKKSSFPSDFFPIERAIPMSPRKRNLSLAEMGFEIYNSGSMVLQDYKLVCEFDKNFQSIDDDDEEGGWEVYVHKESPFEIRDNIVSYSKAEPLVQKDSRSFTFFVKPHPKEYTLQINWRFLARDFDKSGTCQIIVKPQFFEVPVTRAPRDDEIDGDILIQISEYKQSI